MFCLWNFVSVWKPVFSMDNTFLWILGVCKYTSHSYACHCLEIILSYQLLRRKYMFHTHEIIKNKLSSFESFKGIRLYRPHPLPYHQGASCMALYMFLFQPIPCFQTGYCNSKFQKFVIWPSGLHWLDVGKMPLKVLCL